MAGDPFVVLGVSRDASAGDIKWAYERRLSEAARLGATKLAQELNAAYEVLRDPRRRALFERHGIAEPLPRLEPAARFAPPPPPVAWRSWSPAESRQTLPPICARRRTPVRTLIVVGLLGTLASFGIGSVVHDHVSWFSRPHTTYVVPPSTAGHWLVICQSKEFGSGYSFVAPSGTRVSCSSGKPPEFTSP